MGPRAVTSPCAFLPNSQGLTNCGALSMALAPAPSNRPLIVYADQAAGGGLTVARYSVSTGWQPVGGRGITPAGVSWASLATDPSGSPWLAYQVGCGAACLHRWAPLLPACAGMCIAAALTAC